MSIILHIPHSSDIIPVYDGYIVGEQELNDEIMLLTDWYTDDLFSILDSIIIKAGFSRVFCDVERFVEDSDEIMAKRGMGFLYTHSDSGDLIRNVTPELKERILNQFYRPHHKRLSDAVKTAIEGSGKAIIIDCHSFADEPFKRDLNQRQPRPDFNIGFDDFHTPQTLIDDTVSFFQSRNFSVGINWPYSGTIVPMGFYKKDSSVSSIMLEVNRRLYLKENSIKKSGKYYEIKNLIKEFVQSVQGFF